jgi:hypothetical protein
LGDKELVSSAENRKGGLFERLRESSQTKIGDPVNFMVYFIERLKAYAFIGTEAQIPTLFADDFGKRFVEEYLRGEPLGKIMCNARKFYARKYHNPFGLYYTLYGDGKVRLKQSVQEKAS